jgi:hypothetical protein
LRELRDSLYWDYWRLGVSGDPRGAEHWYQQHLHLSFWEDLPLVCPGFYRGKSAAWRQKKMKSPYYPVAIFLVTPVDENHEVCGDSNIWMKAGWQDASDDENSLVSVFRKCRHDPVTAEAYRFAAMHGVWADTIPDKHRTFVEAMDTPIPFIGVVGGFK